MSRSDGEDSDELAAPRVVYVGKLAQDPQHPDPQHPDLPTDDLPGAQPFDDVAPGVGAKSSPRLFGIPRKTVIGVCAAFALCFVLLAVYATRPNKENIDEGPSAGEIYDASRPFPDSDGDGISDIPDDPATKTEWRNRGIDLWGVGGYTLVVGEETRTGSSETGTPVSCINFSNDPSSTYLATYSFNSAASITADEFTEVAVLVDRAGTQRVLVLEWKNGETDTVYELSPGVRGDGTVTGAADGTSATFSGTAVELDGEKPVQVSGTVNCVFA